MWVILTDVVGYLIWSKHLCCRFVVRKDKHKFLNNNKNYLKLIIFVIFEEVIKKKHTKYNPKRTYILVLCPLVGAAINSVKFFQGTTNQDIFLL
jgi:hypothetical protein